MTISQQQFEQLSAMGIQLWQRKTLTASDTSSHDDSIEQLKDSQLLKDILLCMNVSLNQVSYAHTKVSLGSITWQFSQKKSVHLQGNLLKPDNPIFEILFPNTSGTVVSEINYRLSDPQRSQLQAISLLSQGIFINDVSLSMQGITNNLYEKASDIFTSILGNNDEKLKVGINYLQGDRNSELDIFSEDRLGLTLSTQVSDKILINGKIGVPVGGVNETLIVGDVQIDFILNDEGSLRAKVFNKENEFRYIGDELGYTQGVGISYDVDFNTFKEMIQKIISNKRESIEQIESRENKRSEIVKFIKKN